MFLACPPPPMFAGELWQAGRRRRRPHVRQDGRDLRAAEQHPMRRATSALRRGHSHAAEKTQTTECSVLTICTSPSSWLLLSSQEQSAVGGADSGSNSTSRAIWGLHPAQQCGSNSRVNWLLYPAQPQQALSADTKTVTTSWESVLAVAGWRRSLPKRGGRGRKAPEPRGPNRDPPRAPDCDASPLPAKKSNYR